MRLILKFLLSTGIVTPHWTGMQGWEQTCIHSLLPRGMALYLYAQELCLLLVSCYVEKQSHKAQFACPRLRSDKGGARFVPQQPDTGVDSTNH